MGAPKGSDRWRTGGGTPLAFLSWSVLLWPQLAAPLSTRPRVQPRALLCLVPRPPFSAAGPSFRSSSPGWFSFPTPMRSIHLHSLFESPGDSNHFLSGPLTNRIPPRVREQRNTWSLSTASLSNKYLASQPQSESQDPAALCSSPWKSEGAFTGPP